MIIERCTGAVWNGKVKRCSTTGKAKECYAGPPCGYCTGAVPDTMIVTLAGFLCTYDCDSWGCYNNPPIDCTQSGQLAGTRFSGSMSFAFSLPKTSSCGWGPVTIGGGSTQAWRINNACDPCGCSGNTNGPAPFDFIAHGGWYPPSNLVMQIQGLDNGWVDIELFGSPCFTPRVVNFPPFPCRAPDGHLQTWSVISSATIEWE